MPVNIPVNKRRQKSRKVLEKRVLHCLKFRNGITVTQIAENVKISKSYASRVLWHLQIIGSVYFEKRSGYLYWYRASKREELSREEVSRLQVREWKPLTHDNTQHRKLCELVRR